MSTKLYTTKSAVSLKSTNKFSSYCENEKNESEKKERNQRISKCNNLLTADKAALNIHL